MVCNSLVGLCTTVGLACGYLYVMFNQPDKTLHLNAYRRRRFGLRQRELVKSLIWLDDVILGTQW